LPHFAGLLIIVIVRTSS